MRNKGFTLIELVVVLAILAMLAALIVPRVAGVAQAAQSSTGAHTVGALVENLELYSVKKQKYPNNLDNLLLQATPPTTLSTNLNSKLWNLLESVTLTAAELGAISEAGITNVHNLDAIGQSVSTAHPLATGDGVAAISDTALTGADEERRLAIIKSVYPSGTIPVGVKLVAFGVGATNTAIGSTMQAPPVHTGVELGQYNKYIAVFVVNGSNPVKLAAAIDPLGGSLLNNVANYKKLIDQ